MLSSFSAVKLEVVLPNPPPVSNPAEQMVMNTMKHGLDVTARLKMNEPATFEDGTKMETGNQVATVAAADYNSGAYNIDRTGSIMSGSVVIYDKQTYLLK